MNNRTYRKEGYTQLIHVYKDGSFIEVNAMPGITATAYNSENGVPIQTIEPDEAMKKMLLKPNRHLYKYDFNSNKIVRNQQSVS